MPTPKSFDLVWFLHYDGEDDNSADDVDDVNDPTKKKDPPPDGKKSYTQKELDDIILKRTEKARRAQKQTIEQLEALQSTLRMTDEQREKMEEEIEGLRKQTLTAEEIAKREAKKAKDSYESQLTVAQKAAQTWEMRYNDLKINHEITSASQKHGVLPTSVPFLEAYLKPKVKLSGVKDETGEITGHVAMVDFTDQGTDGKSVDVQLSVDDTVKRMKELSESYGHLFAAPSGGGIGGNSGNPGGAKNAFRPGMTQQEYMRLRKENPQALYGQDH